MTQSNPYVLQAAEVVSDSKDVPMTAVHMQFTESYHCVIIVGNVTIARWVLG